MKIAIPHSANEFRAQAYLHLKIPCPFYSRSQFISLYQSNLQKWATPKTKNSFCFYVSFEVNYDNNKKI